MASPNPLVILLLVDGARPDVMAELIADGVLPNIEREILGRGKFRTAVSCAPTTTGPAHLPMLTGCYPGTLNIPGIRWLDKRVYQTRAFGLDRFRSYNGIEGPLLNRDLPNSRPTLFDIFDRAFCVYSMVTRGLARGRNLTSYSKLFAYMYGHLTDHWGLVDRVAAGKIIRVLDQEPELVFAVMPNVDSFSHLYHPRSDQTIAAYRFVDATVGRIATHLQRQRRWDRTLFIITSDHGLTATRSHLDLAHFLDRRGIKTLFYPIIWKNRCRVSVMISGNAMGQIYCLDVPAGEICDERHIRDTLGPAWDELCAQPMIDLLIWRDTADSFIVQDHRGRAAIRHQGGKFSYQPLTADPLAYGGGIGPMDSRQALQHSIESDYPDAVVQIVQLFSSPRCGDIVVISRNGCDLRREYEWPEHHGSHGSLCREHMSVPLICNQAGWNKGPARTVDIFSTILQWAGKPPVADADGSSLI